MASVLNVSLVVFDHVSVFRAHGRIETDHQVIVDLHGLSIVHEVEGLVHGSAVGHELKELVHRSGWV